MKASDYIKLIQQEIDKYGDLPVVVKTVYDFSTDLYEESEVIFQQESTAHGQCYGDDYRMKNYNKAFVIATNSGD